MGNRGWLPERGTPADLSSYSHIDLKGVEPHKTTCVCWCSCLLRFLSLLSCTATVPMSGKNAVTQYIINQIEQHKRCDFREELPKLVRK